MAATRPQSRRFSSNQTNAGSEVCARVPEPATDVFGSGLGGGFGLVEDRFCMNS